MIAATRGMAGAGIGLLLADKISPQKRKALGLNLLLIGAVTTIPLIIDVIRSTRTDCKKS